MTIVFTYPVIKRSVWVLMEGAPPQFSVEKLKQDIKKAGDGCIVEVENLHIWNLSNSTVALSVHLRSTKPLLTLAQVTDMCRRKYGIYHTTIQC